MERIRRETFGLGFESCGQALMTLVDAREVTEGWILLMEASGVDCQDFALEAEVGRRFHLRSAEMPLGPAPKGLGQFGVSLATAQRPFREVGLSADPVQAE